MSKIKYIDEVKQQVIKEFIEVLVARRYEIPDNIVILVEEG